jgi:DNA replication protein DnaC
MIERTEILAAMGGLKLFGMKAAYDEIVATAVERRHEPQRVVGDLLTAELSQKQARSIKYQITIAKLPFAKEIDEFAFAETPVNETLVRDLAGAGFLLQQRNLVLVGGTGTGKTHLAVGIARTCIRGGARGRFFNVVDLVNKLEAEARAGRQGRLADRSVMPGELAGAGAINARSVAGWLGGSTAAPSARTASPTDFPT